MTSTRSCIRLGLVLSLVLLAIAREVPAASTQLTLDTNLSTVRISIDAFGKRDTQTSRLSGFVQVDLDPVPVPTRLAVGEFSMSTLEQMNFSLDFGFLGNATSKVNDLELRRVEPPIAPEFVPLAGDGTFSVANVRYRTFGDGSYALTGLPCSLAEGAGRGCQDTVDFDSGPPGTISQMNGTLRVEAGRVKLEIEYFFSQPLDPATPDFATVSGPVTIVANGELPSVEVRLQIGLPPSGNGVVIRWPKSAGSLTLVAIADLKPPMDWQAVDASPLTNGDFLEVHLPAAAAKRYFRLQ